MALAGSTAESKSEGAGGEGGGMMEKGEPTRLLFYTRVVNSRTSCSADAPG